MLSRLDPIFRTLFRRTEETDTRQHIRKDESEAYGKDKKDGERGTYTPLEWDDVATVSVGALRAFLETLLSPDTGDTAPPPQGVSEGPSSPSATSRAAMAYHNTGRAVHDPNIETPPPPPPVGGAAAEAVSLGHDFSPEDIAEVRQFVADLAELQRRGVETLSIQRSQTFLDGVRQAIQTAKTESALP